MARLPVKRKRSSTEPPRSQRIMVGAFSENGPMLEQVGEVSIVANAFNAEYGGFGNWFTNVTIRSGTNQLHGSVFDHLGNDKLNARSFFQPRRTPYRQNEGGFTLAWSGRDSRVSTTARTRRSSSAVSAFSTHVMARVETS